jgi:predicted metal-dependent phosphoesterase TrpH
LKDTPFEADLHVHTIASSDGHSEPREVVETALTLGLSAVAITDHNRSAGAREVARMARGRGLMVVPASEVSSFNGHILALGVAEPIPRGLSPDETIRRINDFGGLAVAAHPGRFYTGLSLQEVKASQFEAVEVANGGSSRRQNHLAGLLANSKGLGRTGGSDAHWPRDIGRCRTVFQAEPTSVEELLEEVRAGRTTTEGHGLSLGEQLSHDAGMFSRWLRRGGRRM